MQDESFSAVSGFFKTILANDCWPQPEKSELKTCFDGKNSHLSITKALLMIHKVL